MCKYANAPFLLFLILVFSGWTLSAQPASTAEIDTIFAAWNSTHVPGGTIAIIEKGSVSYAKAYGMASLEYKVPNTRETIYNLASVSKQFTAFGIVLLEQQGKLSFEDDIRKHLPNLPDFGETITIRHMLNHTSGMRSLHALLGMAGWRDDDRRSNADLMRFMENQRELNFKPGAEYLYCNTGFMFMADIIEKVSGETFEDWMKVNIFDPLGMNHSFVRRDINLVVPNVATSYYGPNDGVFKKGVEYWAYVGSGNMHSTVDDLAKWLNNFRDPKLGGKDAITKMQQNGVLNNGDTIPYAFGINVDTYRGVKRIQHGGAIGGYRSNLVYFPDQEIGIIVLANFSVANPGGKTRELAELLLAEHLGSLPIASPGSTSPPKSAAWQPDMQEKTMLAGRYYSPELDTYYALHMGADNQLTLHHQRHGGSAVTFHQKDELKSEGLQIRLERDKKQRVTGMRLSNGRARNVWFEKVKE